LIKENSSKLALILVGTIVLIIGYLITNGQMTSAGFATSTAIKNQVSVGTKARIEREYKHKITGENLKYYTNTELVDAINAQLEKSLSGNSWQAPNYTNTNYYTTNGSKEYVYVDIYFDTADDLLLKQNISYRLRQRFQNLKEYEAYLKDPTDPDAQPYRIEFQNKLNRQELGDGFSTVEESRFEFRVESEPFSVDNPPPSLPWHLGDFIGYLQKGKYQDYYLEPTNHLLNYLVPKFTNATELKFRPQVVLVTIRNRLHLSIPTNWGSGPNPEQAFIISIDELRVYDAPSNYDLTIGPMLGYGQELEIEFERNTSLELDNAISNSNGAQQDNLIKIREAFLADQKNILAQVQVAFNQIGLELNSVSKSKYQEARAIQK